MFIGILAVPAVVLLIPKYLVLVQLGIYNTYLGMIIPLIADAAGVFIMRQFFINIPVEVEESARLDGASAFRTFWSVVLPMARPAVITLTILSFQASWNELPHFIISRQSPELNTLTSGVATLVSGQLGGGSQFPLKMAAALLMTIPVAIVFFIFQRYFVRGAGSRAPSRADRDVQQRGEFGGQPAVGPRMPSMDVTGASRRALETSHTPSAAERSAPARTADSVRQPASAAARNSRRTVIPCRIPTAGGVSSVRSRATTTVAVGASSTAPSDPRKMTSSASCPAA